MIQMVQPNNIYQLLRDLPCAYSCAVFHALSHLILMQTYEVGIVTHPILQTRDGGFGREVKCPRALDLSE